MNLKFFRDQLKRKDEPLSPARPEEYREELYQAYKSMFESFKELHATRGVPQELIDKLYRVDVAVDNVEPNALDKVRALHREVKERLSFC